MTTKHRFETSLPLLLLITAGYAHTSPVVTTDEIARTFALGSAGDQVSLMRNVSLGGVQKLTKEAAEQLLVSAFQSSDLAVREYAISIGLQTAALDRELVRQVVKVGDLTEHIEEGSKDIVTNSARLAVILFSGEDVVLQSVLKRIAKHQAEPRIAGRLLLLVPSFVPLPEYAISLMDQLAKNELNEVGLAAITALAKTNNATSEITDAALKMVESPEFFAEPSILEQIGKGLPAEAHHLDRLLAIKEKLELESAKPLYDRTVAIYNAQFYAKTLNDAIDRVAVPGSP